MLLEMLLLLYVLLLQMCRLLRMLCFHLLFFRVIGVLLCQLLVFLVLLRLELLPFLILLRGQLLLLLLVFLIRLWVSSAWQIPSRGRRQLAGMGVGGRTRRLASLCTTSSGYYFSVIQCPGSRCRGDRWLTVVRGST